MSRGAGWPCGRRTEGGYTFDVIRPFPGARTPLPRAARAAPPSKGVERAKLLEKLALLHERLSGDPAAFRRAAIEMLQAALASGRDEARIALEDGGTGLACAEALSAQTDDLLRVALEIPPAGSPRRSLANRFRPSSPSAATAAARWRPVRTSTSCSSCPTSRRQASRGRRVHALRAVGPQAEGRPRDPHGRGMPEAGARRHDHPHHAPRGAVHPRRRGACSRPCAALRQRDRRQERAEFVAAKLAERDSAHPARGRVALSRRAQRQGGQGGLARPQHACSGSPNTSIACATPHELVAAGLFTRARIRACSAAARNFCGACAAACISSPAAPRSG